MRRSTTKTIILAVLLGFIAAAAGVGVRLYTAWNSKGETLIDAAKKSAENSASYDALESQGKFNILLMGEDNVDGSRRSDTILFITVDIDDKNIRVLSLPRDTRVMIPGHGTQKLNHAFAYGGQDLMRATVTNYLGEPILYYMIVDYDSFPAFVDMLGGVEIDVPKRMRYVDRAGGLDINIQPGLQTLDGKTALHFVRFRKDALGDIGRIQRQQQFLKAMLKRAYASKLPWGRGRWTRSRSVPRATGSPICRTASPWAAPSSMPWARQASRWSRRWVRISAASPGRAFFHRTWSITVST